MWDAPGSRLFTGASWWRRRRKGDWDRTAALAHSLGEVEAGGMFTRLTPILPVGDVREELTFYQQLGFEQHTDPDETYPVEEFVAIASRRRHLVRPRR